MKSVLRNSIDVFEKESESLWQGKGGNISDITSSISASTEIILRLLEGVSDEDKVNTSAFLKNAMDDMELALRQKDDFMLADCIYYEWREMLLIYDELLEGDV